MVHDNVCLEVNQIQIWVENLEIEIKYRLSEV